jgi:two-component system CheB/CheR fusion protein
MLNADLSIRRFTPRAEELLGLASTDIGRPLVRVNLDINIPQFEHLMLQVMRDATPRQKEFRHDGTSYRLRATPYRTSDNRVEGVVATLFDLTDGQLTNVPPKNDKTKGKKRR